MTRMAAAHAQSLLRAQEATLVAVSKGQSEEKIRQAIHAGVRGFGENRVQEAQDKWARVWCDFPAAHLHMIGALQTNKVREAVKLFDAIHTVDRKSIALALAKEMQKSGKRPSLFIQVNTGEEPQKSGVLPQDASAFITYCKQELELPVIGLMCVPPVSHHPAPHFALLKNMADAHGLTQLSMGMSGDFETAIRFGATHVRIGTALFGERDARM